MIVAFDSSALVKLTIPEDGSDLVDSLWEAAARRAVSTLAYPEVHSALAAAGRTGRIRPERMKAVLEQFSFRWRELDAIDVTHSIASLAGDLVRRVPPLSGADAVHLATAIDGQGEDSVFVTWDKRLSKAARASGLAVAP